MDGIYQVIVIIGTLMGFTEWRYRVLHQCIKHLEKRFDEHIDKRDRK